MKEYLCYKLLDAIVGFCFTLVVFGAFIAFLCIVAVIRRRQDAKKEKRYNERLEEQERIEKEEEK